MLYCFAVMARNKSLQKKKKKKKSMFKNLERPEIGVPAWVLKKVACYTWILTVR